MFERVQSATQDEYNKILYVISVFNSLQKQFKQKKTSQHITLDEYLKQWIFIQGQR